MLGPGVVQPTAALLGPPSGVAIAAVGHELEKFRVGYEPLSGAEGGQVDRITAVLVIPAVGAVVVPLAEPDVCRRDRQPFVGGRRAARGARAPETLLVRREFVAMP